MNTKRMVPKNRGPTSAPEPVELIPSLERELCNQCDRARVACKYGPRIIEVCIARRDERFVARSHRTKAVDVIHSQPKARIASGNVLGMVDDVPELRAKPELHLLRKVHVLVDAEVDVVGSRRLQCVPTRVGQCSNTGSYELSRRNICDIGHQHPSVW